MVHAESSSARTIAVNPTAIGNFCAMGVVVESATAGHAPSAVSGGNCTGLSGSGGWTLIGATTGLTSTSATFQLSLWAGRASATGSTNATVTSSAPGGTWLDLDMQQWTCAGVSAATSWTQDGAGATRINGTASSNALWPSLTPANTNSMYYGFVFPAGHAAATGQTAGYTIAVDSIFNAIMWDTSVTGVQSPTSANTASIKSSTLAGLITATNPAAATGKFLPFFQAPGHHEDELERRPSGLYVQRRRVFGYRGPSRVLAKAGR
jgi:hypothetical protein